MREGGGSRKSLRELYSLYKFFSSSKEEKLLISTVLIMLLLSWMYNAPLLAQIAGTATFALFLYVIWKQMKENKRQFDIENPDFDHDGEVFTTSTLYVGLVTFCIGLPCTLVGMTGISKLGNLPQENVGFSDLIEIHFWTPFAFLMLTSIGLGLQYMGLYTCRRYLVQ